MALEDIEGYVIEIDDEYAHVVLIIEDAEEPYAFPRETFDQLGIGLHAYFKLNNVKKQNNSITASGLEKLGINDKIPKEERIKPLMTMTTTVERLILIKKF